MYSNFNLLNQEGKNEEESNFHMNVTPVSHQISYSKDVVDLVSYLANHLMYEFVPTPLYYLPEFSKLKMGEMNAESAKETLNTSTGTPSQSDLSSDFKEKKIRRVGPTEADNETLKGYKFRYRYLDNSIRKKRVIVCMYDGCTHEFSKTWNFLDHARMHLGLKPFTCSICNLTFTQKGNMVKHEKQHALKKKDQIKPYKCNLCHRSYTEKYNLKVSLSPQN